MKRIDHTRRDWQVSRVVDRFMRARPTWRTTGLYANHLHRFTRISFILYRVSTSFMLPTGGSPNI